MLQPGLTARHTMTIATLQILSYPMTSRAPPLKMCRSGKTVVLTLWGDNVAQAAALEGQEGGVVVSCSACRVTDYNGCSLSTLTRSVLTVDPDVPAAAELMQWWRDTGSSSTTLQPVGGEAAAARTPGG
jgi:replication factor A1